MKAQTTQASLKSGNILLFDNERHCIESGSDDIRAGFIRWNDRFNVFCIFFNGICIGSFKTFKATEKRIEKLFDKWNCELTSVEKN